MKLNLLLVNKNSSIKFIRSVLFFFINLISLILQIQKNINIGGFVYQFLILFLLGFSNVSYAQNLISLEACNKFVSQVKSENLVETSLIQVPLDYSDKNSKQKMNVFYWQRKGTNPSKVPVLLIHGGPGGNSWRYYNAQKKSSYEGDIVAMDNRNEGCSHVKAYDDLPDAYDKFRARNIVRDLEALRIKLYGKNSKWRIFGQSRGTTISHYYLEMFPESLESVQTHGGAMTTAKTAEKYTLQRSYFNARGSQRFALKFPEGAEVVRTAKKYFQDQGICLPMNLGMMNLPISERPTVCGALITDSISYKLSNYARWKDLSDSLTALKLPDGSLDTKKVVDNFQKEIDGNIYVQYMNYILGTNSRDNGSPAPRNFQAINNDRELQKALISEGRFVANAVYPAYLSLGYPRVLGSSDQLDFNNVKSFLKNYEAKNSQKFKLTIFSSYFDTIGGPEMYVEEKQILGEYVDFKILPNSGHEGWGTEKEILDLIFR